MKLLFDQNLSFRLVAALEDLYPGSSHVRLLDMETADDETIWQYARKNGFVIVSQDSDFNERGLIHGYPPESDLGKMWQHSHRLHSRHPATTSFRFAGIPCKS